MASSSTFHWLRTRLRGPAGEQRLGEAEVALGPAAQPRPLSQAERTTRSASSSQVRAICSAVIVPSVSAPWVGAAVRVGGQDQGGAVGEARVRLAVGGEVEVAEALELARAGQPLHGQLARPAPRIVVVSPSGKSAATASTSRRVPGKPGARPAAHPEQDPLGLAAGPDERRRRPGIDGDAQRPGGDLDLAGDPLAPVSHRHLLRPAVGGDRLEVAGLLQLGPGVAQEDVPLAEAVEVGVAVGHDAGQGEPEPGGSGAGASSLGSG